MRKTHEVLRLHFDLKLKQRQPTNSFAPAMLLTHHYVPLAFLLLAVVAELTVALAVGMRRSVLFPQQLQGDVLVVPEALCGCEKSQEGCGPGHAVASDRRRIRRLPTPLRTSAPEAARTNPP